MSDITNGNGKRWEQLADNAVLKFFTRAVMIPAILGMGTIIGYGVWSKLEEQTGALTKLTAKIDEGFKEIDRRLDDHDVRLTRVETIESVRNPQ